MYISFDLLVNVANLLALFATLQLLKAKHAFSSIMRTSQPVKPPDLGNSFLQVLERPLSKAGSSEYTFPSQAATDDRVAKSVMPDNKYESLTANGASMPKPKPLVSGPT